MPGIVVVHDADAPWETPPPEWLAKQKPGNPGLRFKRLMPGVPGRPNVQRTQYQPGHPEAPHSHPEDEVICVLDGELHFGNVVLRAGDMIYVPRNRIYSLHTGDRASRQKVGTGFWQIAMRQQRIRAGRCFAFCAARSSGVEFLRVGMSDLAAPSSPGPRGAR